MKLSSVDFVRRGANPAADIALYKSADMPQEDLGLEIDVAKANDELSMFTNALGHSFSTILKDHTLDDEEKLYMLHKSIGEFVDTMGEYLPPLDILEKSDDDYFLDSEDYLQTAKSSNSKGDLNMTKFVNVDKSRLDARDQATLDYLIAKANGEEKFEKEDDVPAGKVNPAKAKEEMEDEKELPPALKKAFDEAMAKVYTLQKSAEMRELEEVAKKYECLGKKASEEALVLYDMRKAGEEVYKKYVAALDAQVEIVDKSGLFAEIGKSGNYNYAPVAKSEPETQIETIAKSYMTADPSLSYDMAVTKAWENNPQLFAAYEQGAGF